MTEIVVVGGGPAGLATAIAARQVGLEAMVLDGSGPLIDKACGEGLMPAALEVLEDLGIDLDELGGKPFRGVRFVDGMEVAEGLFGGRPGLGVRRLRLHEVLVRRAESVGVDLRWRQPARSVELDGDEVRVVTDEGVQRAEWLVAADGLHSRLRKWTGLQKAAPRRSRFGVRRHYNMRPWSDLVEVHWAGGCEAYVTPVAQELVGVAMLWSGRKASFDELLTELPHLAERLEGMEPASTDRGAGPLRQRVSAVTRGRVALVGDAAGYVDAVSGEGLAIAFREAAALVSAVQLGNLRHYRREHRRIVRAPNLMTQLTLLLTRSPRLRRKVIRIFADNPRLFGDMLALQNHELSLARRGTGVLARLATKILLPG